MPAGLETLEYVAIGGVTWRRAGGGPACRFDEYLSAVGPEPTRGFARGRGTVGVEYEPGEPVAAGRDDGAYAVIVDGRRQAHAETMPRVRSQPFHGNHRGGNVVHKFRVEYPDRACPTRGNGDGRIERASGGVYECGVGRLHSDSLPIPVPGQATLNQRWSRWTCPAAPQAGRTSLAMSLACT